MPTTYAVPDGRVAMAATLYTGNGSTQTISNAVNGVSFQPDFIWFKGRNQITNHLAQDVIRGAGYGLNPNATNAEANGVGTGLTAFGSGGFSLSGDFSGAGSCNSNTFTYVGWQWKAGGTAVSNTAGTITSSVSANPTAGFSVVTYTGNGTNGATVGHGLGVAPKLLIVKNRSVITSWPVYHGSFASGSNYMFLESTSAVLSNNTVWNGTVPGATTFTIGTDVIVNTNTNTYVAYCWAPVAGYSAFGSYTGNGSTDGPFVYTGFRPRWIMAKASVGGTENWYVYDTARDTYNYASLGLLPNLSNAETNYGQIDILSNGFKMRGVGSSWNASAVTYIYAAFAENPLKYANAR